MEQYEINRNLKDRIKEIYNGTTFKIRINKEVSEELNTKKARLLPQYSIV